MARTAIFLNPGADLAPALALARRADSLGYESLWVTHGIGRDALLTLSAYAHVAPHAGLGTGVIPIYPRHPVAMAQEASTLMELSNGRLRLGIGLSHRFGARIGGGFGAGHFGGPGAAFARGFAGQRFAGTRGHFDRGIRSSIGCPALVASPECGASDVPLAGIGSSAAPVAAAFSATIVPSLNSSFRSIPRSGGHRLSPHIRRLRPRAVQPTCA